MFSCCCEKRNLDQGGEEAQEEEEADPAQPGAAPFKCGAHRSFLCFKSINFDIVGWNGRDAKLCQKLVLFYGVKNIYFCLDSLWNKNFYIFSSAGRDIRQSVYKMLQSRVGRVEKFKHTSK